MKELNKSSDQNRKYKKTTAHSRLNSTNQKKNLLHYKQKNPPNL